MRKLVSLLLSVLESSDRVFLSQNVGHVFRNASPLPDVEDGAVSDRNAGHH